MRTTNDMAETVNMAEPKPLNPRNNNRWKKSVEVPATKVVIATIIKPEVKTTLSEVFSIKIPEIGDEINLVKAKRDTTVLAANALTPNDRANNGIAGARMPKPRATENAIEASTQMAGGRSLMLPAGLVLVDNYGSLLLPQSYFSDYEYGRTSVIVTLISLPLGSW